MNIFKISCDAMCESLSLNDEQKNKMEIHFKYLSETIGAYVKSEILKHSFLIEDEETKMEFDNISKLVKEKISNLNIDISFLENLSSIEHDQWIAWAKSVYPEVSDDRKKRWDQYFVPYKDLDEKIKSYDRIWAYKVMLMCNCKDFYLVNKIQEKSVEYLKSCMENFDQGQFDPDLIDVYKNQVLNQFVNNMIEGINEIDK